ncbi:hypothetical protein [Ornithinimicrobium tianjinense]|uniref:Uncharacterized protein n=1 Tax=Ornithinimicrobium tianjinense TaxID=1195761 RepID=A0A917BVW4_9MICO|nr:hypothetical protein [Ornithinimicrobium tianjinense]GGF58938.1 hypothetical protein GCM10011366_28470 [Ornithinimicrobium tianjinense]
MDAQEGRTAWTELGAPGASTGVGRPPFRYRIEVPPGWKVLRADQLAQDVEAMCVATPGWSNLPPAQQVALRQALTDVGTQARVGGAVLVAADAGYDKDTGEMLMGALTLAWVRTWPLEADTELAELMAQSSGQTRQFAGAHSVGVLQSGVADTGTEVVPGAGSTARTTQAFVPTPGTSWMAVVTGTTPQQRMAALMERATERMAASLLLDDAGESATVVPAGDGIP